MKQIPKDVYYNFLCAHLNGSQESAELIRHSSPNWNWDTVVELASNELILPLLYDKLKAQLNHSSDSLVRNVFLSSRNWNEERNSLFLEELAHIGGLANQIAIEPIVLKGTAHILTELYEAKSDRHLTDIDILIPEAQIVALVQRAKDSGYAEVGAKVGVDCHHVTPLRRPGRPVIEFHHQLGRGRLKRMLPASDVATNSISLSFAGVKVRVPSNEHAFLHHVLHAQLRHSYADALWPTLREAYDCLLLTKRLCKDGRLWSAISEFEKKNSSDLITIHLCTIRDILGTAIPCPTSKSAKCELRLQHRKLLRSRYETRYLNPYFLARSIIVPRLVRLRDLARTREGLMQILHSPMRRSFYRNLRDDIF